MPTVTLLRFTRDEDGRDKVCEDQIIPKERANDYPWPPSEHLVITQAQPILVDPELGEPDALWFNAGIMGSDDDDPDNTWPDTIEMLRKVIAEINPESIYRYRALIFKRHKYSPLDPRTEESPHLAPGAHYVLVETITEPAQVEVEVTKITLPPPSPVDSWSKIVAEGAFVPIPETEPGQVEALEQLTLMKDSTLIPAQTCVFGEKILYLAWHRALAPGHVYSPLGAKEVKITGYCQYHFDYLSEPGWIDVITGLQGLMPSEEASDESGD